MSAIEDVIASTVADAVGRALSAHLPRLTLTRAEAADLLGVSTTTVDQRVRAGDLDTIAAGRITLASVLALAGWPLTPAPLSAPLSTIPTPLGEAS